MGSGLSLPLFEELRRYELEGTSCWNYNSTSGRLENEKSFKSQNKSLSQCQWDQTANQQKNYFYDSYGRLDQTDSIIRNVNANADGVYSTVTTFDSYGRVNSTTYPNGLSITNLYQNGYLDQRKNTDTGRVYQNINSMNHYGQVTSVSYANGTKETIGYRSQDGKVATHDLRLGFIQKHFLAYGYDDNNNINYRSHRFYDQGMTHWKENLTYDSLNRLDYRNVTVYDSSFLGSGFQVDQNYNYDDWGNLTYKYGAGYYKYDTTKKNRLESIHQKMGFDGARYYNMSYDANGNITNDGAGRTFSYFSFDKVNRISEGSQYSEFLYGSDRARYYKHDRRSDAPQQEPPPGCLIGLNPIPTPNVIDNCDNNLLTTGGGGISLQSTDSSPEDYYTVYVGAYEKIHRTGGNKATLTEHKVNLGNIVITERSNGTDDEHYLHKDHLGSPITITNKSGAVVQQFTYDPWGKQTNIYQSNNYLNLVYNQPTNRGYTGHEHIRDLDIIHMNGRIYDANIGRFMQADPFVQSPGNFQNYNRYSYVLNNPLSMTDPSGFFFNKLFKKAFRSVIRRTVKIFGAELTNTVGNILSYTLGGPLGSAYWTYNFNRAMGASSTGALRSAFISAATAFTFQQIGEQFNGAKGSWNVSGGPAHIAAHAIAGGVIADLQGGKFGHGFLSAGITKGMNVNGIVGTTQGVGWDAFRIAVSATIGGTVSKLTGGKFANGATTAAFAQAYNGNSQAKQQEYNKILNNVLGKLSAQDFADAGHFLRNMSPSQFKQMFPSYKREDIFVQESKARIQEFMFKKSLPAIAAYAQSLQGALQVDPTTGIDPMLILRANSIRQMIFHSNSTGVMEPRDLV